MSGPVVAKSGAAISGRIAVRVLRCMDNPMLREPWRGTMCFGVKMPKTEADRGNSVADELKAHRPPVSVVRASLERTLREMQRVAETGDFRGKIEGMKRFGIRPERPLGLNTPQLRMIARGLRPNQALADALWETGIHDARILAGLVGDPDKITRTTMDRWVRGFASWDVCDACCCCLFDKSPHAWSQIHKWARRRDEFVRRAAFATIAALAVHDKKAEDRVFLDALRLIEQYAFDERNFVKKAVNWALRNIGKRNNRLLPEAIACAERVRMQGTPPARWIAADALRELKARAARVAGTG
jgi:3-methyladenine DNA glycosylase AlkD